MKLLTSLIYLDRSYLKVYFLGCLPIVRRTTYNIDMKSFMTVLNENDNYILCIHERGLGKIPDCDLRLELVKNGERLYLSRDGLSGLRDYLVSVIGQMYSDCKVSVEFDFEFVGEVEVGECVSFKALGGDMDRPLYKIFVTKSCCLI